MSIQETSPSAGKLIVYRRRVFHALMSTRPPYLGGNLVISHPLSDYSIDQGVELVEGLALQLLSKYKVTKGPLREYFNRKEDESEDQAVRRQKMAWNGLQKIFKALIEKKLGQEDMAKECIKAWWRAELVVQLGEDNFSALGKRFADALDPELRRSFSINELSYKADFMAEDLTLDDVPIEPSDGAQPSHEASSKSRKSHHATTLEMLRNSERDMEKGLSGLGLFTWKSLFESPDGQETSIDWSEATTGDGQKTSIESVMAMRAAERNEPTFPKRRL